MALAMTLTLSASPLTVAANEVNPPKEELKEESSGTLSGNVWSKMCFSGKQSTILVDNKGKCYAVKGTSFFVGQAASSNDPKAIKINKKGIAKIKKGSSLWVHRFMEMRTLR